MTSKKTIDDVLKLIETYRQNEERIDDLRSASEALQVDDLENQRDFAKELSEIAIRDAKVNIKLVASAFIVQLTQKTMEDIENIQDMQEMYSIARTLKTCLELYEEC